MDLQSVEGRSVLKHEISCGVCLQTVDQGSLISHRKQQKKEGRTIGCHTSLLHRLAFHYHHGEMTVVMITTLTACSVSIAKLCLTLGNSMKPIGLHRIFQARILVQVTISYLRELSQPRN